MTKAILALLKQLKLHFTGRGSEKEAIREFNEMMQAVGRLPENFGDNLKCYQNVFEYIVSFASKATSCKNTTVVVAGIKILTAILPEMSSAMHIDYQDFDDSYESIIEFFTAREVELFLAFAGASLENDRFDNSIALYDKITELMNLSQSQMSMADRIGLEELMHSLLCYTFKSVNVDEPSKDYVLTALRDSFMVCESRKPILHTILILCFITNFINPRYDQIQNIRNNIYVQKLLQLLSLARYDEETIYNQEQAFFGVASLKRQKTGESQEGRFMTTTQIINDLLPWYKESSFYIAYLLVVKEFFRVHYEVISQINLQAEQFSLGDDCLAFLLKITVQAANLSHQSTAAQTGYLANLLVYEIFSYYTDTQYSRFYRLDSLGALEVECAVCFFARQFASTEFSLHKIVNQKYDDLDVLGDQEAFDRLKNDSKHYVKVENKYCYYSFMELIQIMFQVEQTKKMLFTAAVEKSTGDTSTLSSLYSDYLLNKLNNSENIIEEIECAFETILKLRNEHNLIKKTLESYFKFIEVVEMQDANQDILQTGIEKQKPDKFAFLKGDNSPHVSKMLTELCKMQMQRVRDCQAVRNKDSEDNFNELEQCICGITVVFSNVRSFNGYVDYDVMNQFIAFLLDLCADDNTLKYEIAAKFFNAESRYNSELFVENIYNQISHLVEAFSPGAKPAQHEKIAVLLAGFYNNIILRNSDQEPQKIAKINILVQLATKERKGFAATLSKIYQIILCMCDSNEFSYLSNIIYEIQSAVVACQNVYWLVKRELIDTQNIRVNNSQELKNNVYLCHLLAIIKYFYISYKFEKINQRYWELNRADSGPHSNFNDELINFAQQDFYMLQKFYNPKPYNFEPDTISQLVQQNGNMLAQISLYTQNFYVYVEFIVENNYLQDEEFMRQTSFQLMYFLTSFDDENILFENVNHSDSKQNIQMITNNLILILKYIVLHDGQEMYNRLPKALVYEVEHIVCFLYRYAGQTTLFGDDIGLIVKQLLRYHEYFEIVEEFVSKLVELSKMDLYETILGEVLANEAFTLEEKGEFVQFISKKYQNGHNELIIRPYMCKSGNIINDTTPQEEQTILWCCLLCSINKKCATEQLFDILEVIEERAIVILKLNPECPAQNEHVMSVVDFVIGAAEERAKQGSIDKELARQLATIANMYIDMYVGQLCCESLPKQCISHAEHIGVQVLWHIPLMLQHCEQHSINAYYKKCKENFELLRGRSEALREITQGLHKIENYDVLSQCVKMLSRALIKKPVYSPTENNEFGQMTHDLFGQVSSIASGRSECGQVNQQCIVYLAMMLGMVVIREGLDAADPFVKSLCSYIDFIYDDILNKYTEHNNYSYMNMVIILLVVYNNFSVFADGGPEIVNKLDKFIAAQFVGSGTVDGGAVGVDMLPDDASIYVTVNITTPGCIKVLNPYAEFMASDFRQAVRGLVAGCLRLASGNPAAREHVRKLYCTVIQRSVAAQGEALDLLLSCESPEENLRACRDVSEEFLRGGPLERFREQVGDASGP